jgi:hypothetical protein
MTEKRFTFADGFKIVAIKDNGQIMNSRQVCELLNELHEENKELKHLLQDLGVLMTDEEVKDIRTEIADKFIKPLCKENGFDVDVDCTDGFTIIPKGDVE